MLVATVSATVLIFRDGLRGPAITATVIDDTIVRWVSGVDAPGLHKAARMLTAVSSWWTIQILSWALPIVLLVLRRWRHLVVTMIVIQLAQILYRWLIEIATRPRPFGVALRAGWGGWALPSEQMLASDRDPPGGALHARARRSVAEPGEVGPRRSRRARRSGPPAPRRRRATDIVVAVVIAVAFPVVAFRVFVPNEYFPVAYGRGRSAHLDVGGARGDGHPRCARTAARAPGHRDPARGVERLSGFDAAASAGRGEPPYHLFGKLYSRTHLRSDRWYKLGRELLYGRLEDEKPFNAVRQLVQQEDYALRVVRDVVYRARPPSGSSTTPRAREYMLVTEFFEGAVELSEAEVDDALIDDGLRVYPAPVGCRHRPPRTSSPPT